jgi:hypothetical protein
MRRALVLATAFAILTPGIAIAQAGRPFRINAYFGPIWKDLLPGAAATYDLGSGALPWRDLHLSRDATIAGTATASVLAGSTLASAAGTPVATLTADDIRFLDDLRLAGTAYLEDALDVTGLSTLRGSAAVTGYVTATTYVGADRAGIGCAAPAVSGQLNVAAFIDTPDIETATVSARDGTTALTLEDATGKATLSNALVLPLLSTIPSGHTANVAVLHSRRTDASGNRTSVGFEGHTDGRLNFACGWDNHRALTTGYSNHATGHQVQRALTSGNSNHATGYQVQYSLTTGYSNHATGIQAQYSLTTGHSNHATGGLTQYSLTSGNSNHATGYQVQYSLTSGNSNHATGAQAQYYQQTGSNNASLCTSAAGGLGNYSSTNVLALGAFAAQRIPAGATTATMKNVVALGTYAGHVPTSDNAYIGGYDTVGLTQYPLSWNLEVPAADLATNSWAVKFNRDQRYIPYSTTVGEVQAGTLAAADGTDCLTLASSTGAVTAAGALTASGLLTATLGARTGTGYGVGVGTTAPTTHAVDFASVGGVVNAPTGMGRIQWTGTAFSLNAATNRANLNLNVVNALAGVQSSTYADMMGTNWATVSGSTVALLGNATMANGSTLTAEKLVAVDADGLALRALGGVYGMALTTGTAGDDVHLDLTDKDGNGRLSYDGGADRFVFSNVVTVEAPAFAASSYYGASTALPAYMPRGASFAPLAAPAMTAATSPGCFWATAAAPDTADVTYMASGAQPAGDGLYVFLAGLWRTVTLAD